MKLLSPLPLQLAVITSSLFWASVSGQACSAFGSCDECLSQGCSWVNSTCDASCNIFTNIFRQGLECLTLVESDNVTVGELCLRASASEDSTGVTDDSGSDDFVGDEFLDFPLSGNVTFNMTFNATFNDTNATMFPSSTPNPSELINVDDEDGTNETTVAPSADADADASVSPRGKACESTEDCDDKAFFCSSATSTCLDLNCTNWLEGTPEGKLPFGEEPCISEVDGIESRAGFCSPYDGECHDYSCQAWYEFGPVAYTGYDPFNPVELTCEDYEDGERDRMNSVVFGCRPYTPGNKAPEARTWTFYFNQICTSEPRSGHEFTCYNNKDDTDYRDYLGEIARFNPPFCDPEVYEGITTQSAFWYNTIMAQNRSGVTAFHKDGRANTTSTSQFDPSEADRTMFSFVFSEEPVPEQVIEGDPPPSGATPSAPLLTRTLLFSGLGALVASLCL